MFENLLFREEKDMHYGHIFLIGMLISVLALFITNFLLKFQQGLVSVFIVSLAAAYPVVKFLKNEVEKEEYLAKKGSEKALLKRHEKEVSIYLSLFLGVMIVFSLSYYFLPQNFFQIQISTISNITGKFASGSLFNSIVINNLRIFSLTFLLSFFLSAGMIFILVWNASVLGVFLAKESGTMMELPTYALAYLPHGIIEIAAYVIAGIAGLILSTEIGKVIKSDSKITFRVLQDVSFLIILGVGFVFLGAIIEVL